MANKQAMTQADEARIWHIYCATRSRRETVRQSGVSEWRVRMIMQRGQAGLYRGSESPASDQKAETDDQIAIAPISPGSDQKPETQERKNNYELRADGRIIINRLSRTVTTDLGEFGQVTRTFEQHAAMLRRYSDDWEQTHETIPEIARDFDLHPRAFDRYKSIHGWTHAHDPYTDLEWEDGLDVQTAVDQTLLSQRRAFQRKLQQQRWQQTLSDADKWRRLEELALQPMLDAITRYAPDYRIPQLALAPAPRVFDVIICAPDLHYGKYGWQDETGSGYSRAQARDVLIARTARIIEQVACYGQPRRVLTAIGNDWFHIDTDKATTTAGTAQDIDGSPAEILWTGSELAITQIDLLAQLAPVTVCYVRGNHDALLGLSLLHSLHAWYHTSDQVTVVRSASPRQYLQAGSTLVGFAHGDTNLDSKKLGLLMANEAPELWSKTRHRVLLTGHLHYELTRDEGGILLCQMPSLLGPDRWHMQQGYVTARRALSAYILDDQDGLIATMTAPLLARPAVAA